MQSNKVILAAAGAGKTHDLCESARQNKDVRTLIVSYTNKSIEAINTEYMKQNKGIVDNNVVIMTWYQFLLNELIKPYQTYITKKYNEINSIDFSEQYGVINYGKKGEKKRYITANNDIRSNYACEFAILCNNVSEEKVLKRLESIYSYIYIDELQDLVGDDLYIIDLLFSSKIAITLVGDYKQTTFKTHNTKIKAGKTGIDIKQHFEKLKDKGIISLEIKNKCRRCNEDICAFANLIIDDGEKIISVSQLKSLHDGVFLLKKADLELYYNEYSPVPLKYDSKTKTDGKQSFNFGQCKGLTFTRTLIFPNGPLNEFLKKRKKVKAPYKYYVAVTRAVYSVAFVVEDLIDNEIFSIEAMEINGHKITISKFKPN